MFVLLTGLSPPYGWTHCANSTIGAGGAFYPAGVA